MSLDMVGQLNWLAVVAGAIIYYVLGAIWYAPPVLGRAWQRSIGWDPATPPPRMSPTLFVLPLIAYLVISAGIGMLAAATGSTDVTGGLTLGVVLGLAFAVGRTAVDAIFDPNRPQRWTWFAITAGYHFIAIVIIAVLLSVWV
jgi:hypothetical protein